MTTGSSASQQDMEAAIRRHLKADMKERVRVLKLMAQAHTCGHVPSLRVSQSSCAGLPAPSPPTTSPEAVTAAVQKKEEGNALFRAQKMAEAAEQYGVALGLISVHPSVLLSNRAVCFASLGLTHEAAAAAGAAVLLDQRNVKAPDFTELHCTPERLHYL